MTLPPPSWEDGPALPAGLGDRPLHRMVAEIAARRPDALAVLDDRARLDHAALARLVARWAARLVAEGVAPGAPVGLCAMAEVESPAGFLAILAAGGVVVPLDPALPPERLRALAEGVGCRLILASDAARDRVTGPTPVLALSADPGDHPPVEVTDDPDRAAVLYHTSGSTGRPKPVALPHRTLSARMLSMIDWFGLGGNEVVCAGSTLAFDPFLQQLFFPLCGGGTLWLPERAALLDSARFWVEAAARGLTHLNLVPSQIEALLRRPPAAPLASLRRVVLGGERMAPDLPARIVAALGPVAVYNMYGPTEATVDATGHRADPTVADQEIPIGAPLPGCRVRILDANLKRVPVGEEGELCIGGAGLAIGYAGMAEATAEKFVADPFGVPGDRLYRTGDLARWRPDGRVSFIGRRDEQVKVRGQRIELGEVEAALRAFPGVTAATAGKWEEAPGGGALIAHVTGDVDTVALRGWLAERLPAAAVPARVLRLDALPVLPSGKVDRKALPPPGREEAPAVAPGAGDADAAALERAIAAVWADLLGHPISAPTANLFETGAHSLLVPPALEAIAAATGLRVGAVDLFRFPSVAALARHLSGADRAAPAARRRRATLSGDVAVVGMAFRFPGAADRDGFWANLMGGVESLRRFDLDSRGRDTLRRNGAPSALVDHPDFVPVHAAIDDPDRFDPVPFGYGPGEAAEIDPQQRLLLELAWHALEDAACDPAADGPVGVFAGVGFNAYLLDNLRDRVGFAGGADRYSVVVGADKDFAATRIAYKLGLTGPAMTVNSACSTALSVTATAVDSLRAGRCRVALAGAASLGMFSPYGYIHADGGIASRDGHCRPFDAAADGTVGGAGAAVLVLKRREDAEADGDTIHAVIRGVGIANDGAGKAAFAAPTVDGQVAAITAALDDAGVDPTEVGFVEGHGTATALGDPIEVTALNLAYAGAARDSVLLGSVKGNLGHLDAAAGMAGLVKAVLAVGHGMVPPTAHFTAPNPRIPFADGPFRVNAAPEPWPGAANRPRLAGVSGFGMGGTNIHVILEGAISPSLAPPPIPESEASPVLITLSAATATALDRLSRAIADHLDGDPALPLPDVASSLARRRTLRHRRAVTAATPADAAKALRAARAVTGEASGGAVSTAFLFPGQGAQRPGMARDLHRAVPAARAVIDAAESLLRGTSAAAVIPLLLADPDDAEAARALAETNVTQPALFITELAIARALEAAGARPTALIGHSVGEYVAATVAGVMTADDALRLVVERGRLMASAPRGAMLAVSLPETDLAPLLAATATELAAVNGPRQCVAAGTEAGIAALADAVAALGKPARRLPVSHAFHCALMDPILDDFAAAVAAVPLRPPRIPILSNVTGAPLTAAEATDPAYWVRHLRGTVRFADGLRALADDPARLLIEAGPGVTLTRLARAAGVPESRAIAAQPAEPANSHVALLETLGRLWVAGAPVNRLAAAGASPRRRPLPGMPFERVRLWIEPGAATPAPTAIAAATITAKTAAANTPAAAPSVSAPAADTPESVIAEVWRDVLGVPTVRPDDDFLALGGDSLIAVRIAARLRERLGREVAAGALFRAGTVAGLAELLGSAANANRPEEEEDATREEGWL